MDDEHAREGQSTMVRRRQGLLATRVGTRHDPYGSLGGTTVRRTALFLFKQLFR